MRAEQATFVQHPAIAFGPSGPIPSPPSPAPFTPQEQEPQVVFHAGSAFASTAVHSFVTVTRPEVIVIWSPGPFLPASPGEKARVEKDMLVGAFFQGGPRTWRPIEMITAAARDFISEHSLSLAIEDVFSAVREAYRNIERITIDLKSDPEVQGYSWLAVTICVAGEVGEILASERQTRSRLRKVLGAQEYRKFVLNYEISG